MIRYRAFAAAGLVAAILAGCGAESPAELRQKAEDFGNGVSSFADKVEAAADITADGIESAQAAAGPVADGVKEAMATAKSRLEEFDKPLPGSAPIVQPHVRLFGEDPPAEQR